MALDETTPKRRKRRDTPDRRAPRHRRGRVMAPRYVGATDEYGGVRPGWVALGNGSYKRSSASYRDDLY